ncbi:hypothetical protein HPP92_027671 [Vanilla planifolia]|uniref:Uncharacterized protein n=1 Tax=Vanilla planifolia TaxID=51239 RepID=A0A835PAY6_VANPL|nr:hypothetical protein HPP92_027671 [Vanilla planifolia]
MCRLCRNVDNAFFGTKDGILDPNPGTRFLSDLPNIGTTLANQASSLITGTEKSEDSLNGADRLQWCDAQMRTLVGSCARGGED